MAFVVEAIQRDARTTAERLSKLAFIKFLRGGVSECVLLEVVLIGNTPRTRKTLKESLRPRRPRAARQDSRVGEASPKRVSKIDNILIVPRSERWVAFPGARHSELPSPRVADAGGYAAIAKGSVYAAAVEWLTCSDKHQLIPPLGERPVYLRERDLAAMNHSRADS
jgi:hypothetical protein